MASCHQPKQFRENLVIAKYTCHNFTLCKMKKLAKVENHTTRDIITIGRKAHKILLIRMTFIRPEAL